MTNFIRLQINQFPISPNSETNISRMLRIPSTAVVRHFLMVPTRQFAQKTKFTAQLPDMLEKISNEKLYFIKDVKIPAPKVIYLQF